MNEKWKDVENYEGLYRVSNLGNVKHLKISWICSRGHEITKKEKILKGSLDKDGYVKVALSKNNKIKLFSVHRLVAQAFIPNPNNLPQVNHIDGNKQNNKFDNLEWCTAKENISHAINTLNVKYSRYINKAWLKNKKKVIRSDGKIYSQVKDVIKELNIKNSQSLYDVLKNRKKEYKGYEYKYY